VDTQYKKPPITEAIISIVFAQPINDTALTDLQRKFSKHYPHSQPIENVHVNLNIGALPNTNVTETRERGYRLSSNDMTELLVLHPKSITVSQLAPYPGWQPFFERFCRDWTTRRRILGFQTVERIGVRYINRVDIPMEGKSIAHEDYLNVFPRVPAELGPLNAYTVQVQIFMDDLKAQLVINSASVPAPILKHASFVIDQDIVRLADVPQKDGDIFDLIGRIRDRKNHVFESCVTDQARSLFRDG
jgi:uncharacterized protein (TIGR04255 family)